jgi:transcriptional regulator with XRE-family HTH domain
MSGSIVHNDAIVNTSGINVDTWSRVLGPEITSELIRAARALLRWEQRDLSEASSVSLATIKRLEAKPGILAAHHSTVAALKRALEAAGVEFTNGASPGVRLRPAPKNGASKLPNDN